MPAPRPTRDSLIAQAARFARPSVRGGGTCHYWALFAPVPQSDRADSHLRILIPYFDHENKNSFSDFTIHHTLARGHGVTLRPAHRVSRSTTHGMCRTRFQRLPHRAGAYSRRTIPYNYQFLWRA